MEPRIRQVLGAFVTEDVSSLKVGDNLYEVAGLSSFASVQLMLALEEEFDIEFPEAMLNRRTFGSIGAIAAAVEKLSSERV